MARVLQTRLGLANSRHYPLRESSNLLGRDGRARSLRAEVNGMAYQHQCVRDTTLIMLLALLMFLWAEVVKPNETVPSAN